MADQQQNSSISGFSDNDIITVLNRAFIETQENRNKALETYDTLTKKMSESDGNLAIMGTYAQNYLDTATKQTSELIKLAGVMQRLKATKIVGDNPNAFDKTQVFNQVLTYLEEKKLTPYNEITDKDMNYKDSPYKEDNIVKEENTVVIKDSNIQTKEQLLGLADINVDELEQEI